MIRPDVSTPLSVDSVVWPSIFKPIQSFPIYPDVTLPQFIVAPQSTDVNHGLWDNLDELLRYIDSSCVDVNDLLVVAVSCFIDDSTRSTAQFGPYTQITVPEKTDPEWTLLGYDVADFALLSGLTNCSYSGEGPSFKEQWGSTLNKFHLFDDAEKALQFAVLAETRIVEHSPFFVYSLRIVSGNVK